MINSNLVNDIQPRGSEDVYIFQTYTIKVKIMDNHIVLHRFKLLKQTDVFTVLTYFHVYFW